VVAPTAHGASRKLVKVDGRIIEGKKQVTYSQAGYRTKEMDIDGAITDSFARELLWRKNGTGPMLSWFPLSKRRMKHYDFAFTGEERYREFDVYKVRFTENDDEDCWSGEALIEKNEFQPVLITTEWTCKIPGAVKFLLGTNVQQVGAKIAYQRFADNVWFPVNCGGEMKLRVLFLYARTIAFSGRNGGFRKSDVTTSVQFDQSDDPLYSPVP
jgi:hypothetical protein